MRINVPVGTSSIKFADVRYRRGLSIQNVSAVDIFYSDDQRLLDSVSPANLPTVGHLLPAATQAIVIYPWFIGQFFCRAQNAGAQLEVIIYDVDNPC